MKIYSYFRIQFLKIFFGEPKNKKNLRKAIDALKKVELYDYVKKLDKGLDHVLLSNGKELSGGQTKINNC